MLTLYKKAAVLGGVFLLTATALPAARAQTTTPDAGTPPTAGTPTTPNTTTPPTTTPATPVPTTETPPDENTPRRNRFRIGPAVGVYFPASGKTRDRFGDSWFSIGLGLGSINPVTTRGSLSLDLNVFYHGRDGNHAFFAPLGIGYRIALSPSADVIPYAGISGDVNFTDITSNPDNIHNSFNVGVGASEFVGVNFRDSAFLEARYYEFSQVHGFDFSGLSLDAGYRF